MDEGDSFASTTSLEVARNEPEGKVVTIRVCFLAIDDGSYLVFSRLLSMRMLLFSRILEFMRLNTHAHTHGHVVVCFCEIFEKFTRSLCYLRTFFMQLARAFAILRILDAICRLSRFDELTVLFIFFAVSRRIRISFANATNVTFECEFFFSFSFLPLDCFTRLFRRAQTSCL